MTRICLGSYLGEKVDRNILYQLAKSENLWDRRISIVSTLHFIMQKGQSTDTIQLAELLLNDEHDLIHKAVGWTLREVGKRIDEKILTTFLDQHHTEMPRTMLRYSIERLSASERKHYMKK